MTARRQLDEAAARWPLDIEQRALVEKSISQMSESQAAAVRALLADASMAVAGINGLRSSRQTAAERTNERKERLGAGRSASPPSLRQLENFVSALRDTDAALPEQEVEGFFRRYLVYAEEGNSPGLMVVGASAICAALLDARGERRPYAADLARRLLQEALPWASDSDRLWGLWAQSLVQMGAFAAAELLYWETVRRFPWNMHLWSQLIGVLRRLPGRADDALRIAMSASEDFPHSGAIKVQLAMLLANSGEASKISDAIRILASQIKRSKKIVYETSALAYVLANAKALTEDDLACVVNELREKPRLLGGIGHRLLSDHKAFAVAQRLWSRRVSDAPTDPISRSQLARAYASSGNPADLQTAISMLRKAVLDFPERVEVANHLAGVLAKTGISEDRDEAVSILRGAIQSHPEDLYARNQLVETLSASGLTSDIEEALYIVSETLRLNPRDQYASELMTVLSAGSDGVVDRPQSIQRERDQAEEHPDAADFGEEVPTDPSEVLPSEVVQLGTIRRLRFELESGAEEERKSTLQRLEEIIRQPNPSIYAELLAVREGILDDAVGPNNGFAFAFERALREEDVATLDELCKTYPRLEALIVVAKAIFGDRLAISEIQTAISSGDDALHPAVRVMRQRLRRHLSVVEGGASQDNVIEVKSEIRAALHDATEAFLFVDARAA